MTKRRLLPYAGWLAGIGFGSLLGYGLVIDSKNDYLYEKAYRKAEAIADVDDNGVTTQDEWFAAYKKAEIKTTFRMKINGNRPSSLSISQLEDIIETDK